VHLVAVCNACELRYHAIRNAEHVLAEDLAVWRRDEVAVNMIDNESCPFRMGPVRNLEQRVAEYHRRGAIAYIPSKAKKWDPSGPYQPLEDKVILVRNAG